MYGCYIYDFNMDEYERGWRKGIYCYKIEIEWNVYYG